MGKKMLALVLSICLIFSVCPLSAYAAGEGTPSGGVRLCIGGTAVTAGQTVFCGTNAALSVSGLAAGTSLSEETYYVLPAQGVTDPENANWTTVTKNGLVSLPAGDYYLGYQYTTAAGDSGSSMDGTYRITMTQAALAAPKDLSWNGGKAVWTAVTASAAANAAALPADAVASYRVTLQKDGAQVGQAQTAAGTSFDFSAMIAANGYGSYTFSVQAVSGKTDLYTDSASAASGGYTPADGALPVVSGLTLTDQGGTLQGTVSDAETGIRAYAFSTAGSVSGVTWTELENTAGTEAVVSAPVTVPGVFYLYAKDGGGNVARSEGITLTAAVLHGAYTNNVQTAKTVFFQGTSSLTLPDGGTRTGYTFAGWYLDEALTQAAGTVSGTGTSLALWAKWDASSIFTQQPAGVSKIYDGQDHTLFTAVSAEDASYQWHRVADGTDTAVAGAVGASLTVRNTADSGEYYCVVSFVSGAQTETRASDRAAVSITPRTLTLRPDDAAAVYGADAPAYSYQVSGAVTGDDLGLTAQTVCAYQKGDAQNGKAGTYPITATAAVTNGNYTVVTESGTLTVSPKNAAEEGSSVTAALAETTMAYTGAAQTPAVAVKDGETPLTEGIDYAVEYSANTEVGTASASLRFQGNYTGVLSLPFAITKATYESATTLTVPSRTYDGTAGSLGLGVTENKSGREPTYYYYPQGTDRAAATTETPVNAGTYRVYAVIPATDSYESVTAAETAFTILPVEVTIKTAGGLWEYDGNPHSAASYTCDRSVFVGTDDFQSIQVTGVITNVGAADNTASYTFPASVTAANYHVTVEAGKLVVTSLALPNPAKFGWSPSAPGTAASTAITKTGVTSGYTLQLCRADTVGGVMTYTKVGTAVKIFGSTYSFASDIRADCEKNGAPDGGYVFTIQTYPASGELAGNYAASQVSGYSAALHAAKVSVQKTAGVAEASIGGADSVWLIAGETAALSAAVSEGYLFTDPVWTGESSDLSLADAKQAGTSVTLSSSFAGSPTGLTVLAAAQDELPAADTFTAENGADLTTVSFSFTAKDSLGITAWAVTGSDTAPAEADTAWHTAAAEGTLPLKQISGTSTVTEPGTYHLYLRDTSGNIAQAPATIDVYQIAFSAGSDGTGTMAPILKAQDTTVTLPAALFQKTGCSFRNWSGETGVYADAGTYAANRSDTLTAVFSGDLVDCPVEVYYMESDGTYPASPQTYTIRASYGSTIERTDGRIIQNFVGFAGMDKDKSTPSVTAGSGQALQLYYMRAQYKITYTWTDIAGTAQTGEDTFYFGQTVTEHEKPTADGYSFVGWDLGDAGSLPETMPNRNLAATGYFASNDTAYLITVYTQDLTKNETTGEYTAASTYTRDTEADISVPAAHGVAITAKTADAPAVPGCTVAAVTVTSGAPGDNVLPAGAGTEAAGTVSAETGKRLYVNYYYTRNTYSLTLNVYKDNRDNTPFYTKTWNYLYGRPFTAAETDAIAVYEKNTWDKDGDGKALGWFPDAADQGYILASYSDWSTGGAPSAMPESDVTVSRDYVQNTKDSYNVQIFLQNKDGTYPDTPAYTLAYFDSIGKVITVGTGETDTISPAFLQSAVDGLNLYEFDSTAAGSVLSGRVQSTAQGGDRLALKVCFKRPIQTGHIYYYYNTGLADSKNILVGTAVKTGAWGNDFDAESTALFFGSTNFHESGASYTSRNVTVDGTAAESYNFCQNGYVISVSISWTNDDGHSSYRGGEVNTEALLSTLQTGKTDAYAGHYGIAGCNVYIYYTKIDRATQYGVDLFFTSKKSGTTSTLGLLYGTLVNEPLTVTVNGTTYHTRIVNKSYVYQATATAGAYTSAYPGLEALNTTYAYDEGNLVYQAGHTFGTVTYQGKTWVTENVKGVDYLYILNTNDTFYKNNRAYCPVAQDDAQTPGFGAVEQYLSAYRAGTGESGASAGDVRKGAAQLYVGSTSFSTAEMMDNSSYIFYTIYGETYSLTYLLNGQSRSYGYAKGETAKVGEYEGTSLDAAFAAQVSEGYRIVWYRDANYTELAPVTITMTENTRLYGRIEKQVQTVTEYVGYELADPVTLNGSPVTRLTKDNLQDFLTACGSEVTQTETTAPSPLQSEYGFDLGAKITETVYTYRGSPVMKVRSVPCLSFSEATLDYSGDGLSGFHYDLENLQNRTNGYCLSAGITLCANFARDEYALAVDYACDTLTNQAETRRYNETVTLTDPVRAGYTFAGYDWYRASEETDGTVTYTACTAAELAALGAQTGSGTVTFTMPGFGLKAAARWTPAAFDTTIRYYFQSQTQKFDTGIFSAIEGLTPTAENVTYHEKTYAAQVYTVAGGQIVSVSAAALGLAEGGVALFRTEAGATALTETQLCAASVPATRTTETKYTPASDELAPDCGLFVWSFSVLQSQKTLTTMKAKTDEYPAYPDMSLAHYFARRSNLTLTVTAVSESGTASGLSVSGGGSYYYEENAAVHATAEPGYAFLGWYKTDGSALGYDSANCLSTAADYSFRMTQSMGVTAVSRPLAVPNAALTVSGQASYVYGYETGKTNTLQTAVTLESGAAATAVKGYQWYIKDEQTQAYTAISGEESAQSATYLFPAGKAAGSYTYVCDVTLQRTDNGLTKTVRSDPYTVTVNKAQMTLKAENYTGVYDAAAHRAALNVTAPAAGRYEIYYSTAEALTAENYLTSGTKAKNAGELPAYQNVRADSEGNVLSYPVYCYVKDLSGNYLDGTGEVSVTIRPKTLTVRAGSAVFEKTYDGNRDVIGTNSDAETDLGRLSDPSKGYYIIDGYVGGDTSDDRIIILDAAFDSAHVKSATGVSVTFRHTNVVAGGAETPDWNYSFPESSTLVFSGQILPGELRIQWGAADSFLFDGVNHVPAVSLASGGNVAAPDAGYLIVAPAGAQTNAGSYTAVAEAGVTAAGLAAGTETADYAVPVETRTKDFTIGKMAITVTPVDETVTYDGVSHTLQNVALTATEGGGAYTLPAGYTLTAGMSGTGTDAGTYDLTARNVQIRTGAGKDAAGNFTVTAGTGTLTITPKTVTLGAVAAADKIYDGGVSAVLDLGAATLTGVCQGDSLSFDKAGLQGVFTDAAAGADKTVTVSLAAGYTAQNLLTGADRGNYRLDLSGSQLTAKATVTKKTVTVSAADLAASAYGSRPAFADDAANHIVFDGFVSGEDKTVVENRDALSFQVDGGPVAAYEKVPAGDHLVTVGGIDGLSAANYTFQAGSPAGWTVEKKTLTVSAAANASVTKNYDGTTAAAVGPEDYVISGGANGETPTLSAAYTASYNSPNVWEANTVTVSGLSLSAADAVNANYTLDTASFAIANGDGRTVSLTRLPLTVTAANKSAVYGAAAPAFTVSYTGLLTGETAAVLAGTLTFSCAYDTENAASRNVGTYVITPSGYDESGSNYTFTYAPGTLTVSQKTLTVTVNKEADGIYSLITALPVWNSTLTGFAYGEGESVLTNENGKAALQYLCSLSDTDATPIGTDALPGAYPVKITEGSKLLTAQNYTFAYVNSTYTVKRQTLTLSGVTVDGKNYDGTTAVAGDAIHFPAKNDTGYAGIKTEDLTWLNSVSDAGFTVQAVYEDSNAGDKTVALTFTLGSYLASRYTLGTDSQKTTAAKIAPIPLVIHGRTDLTVVYGAADPGFTPATAVSTVKNSETGAYDAFVGLAGSDTPASLSAAGASVSYDYKASAAATQVGTVGLTVSGYESRNYTIAYAPGVITVTQAALAAPAASWSEAQPGTAVWTASPAIGDVSAASYQVRLLKDGAQLGSGHTVDASVTAFDFAEIIRAGGAGVYTVTVQAVASETNNEGKKNVADSPVGGASAPLYAANVAVQFAKDAVSAAGSAGGSVRVGPASGVTGESYVALAGETVSLRCVIADAVKTGYAVKTAGASPAALDFGTAAVPAPGETGYGSYQTTARLDQLTSADPITVTFTLQATPAGVTATLTNDQGAAAPEVVFGYQADSLTLTAVPAVKAGDTVGTDGYTYSYKWEVQRGGTWSVFGSDTGTVSFPDGFDFGWYTVRCTVTATRTDNGLAAVYQYAKVTVKVVRATYTPVLTLTGWTYGETRSTPSVSPVKESAAITYRYLPASDYEAAADKSTLTWLTGLPTDAGDYYAKAQLGQTANYNAVETQPVKFTVAATKLATPANIGMSASDTAPYGLIHWDAVTGPQENGGVTPASRITVTYVVKLYERNAQEPVQTLSASGTSLDVSAYLDKENSYRYTVTALSDHTANCASSDESERQIAPVQIDYTATAGTQQKYYDGSTAAGAGITLSLAEKAPIGSTFQWYRNGTAIPGATGAAWVIYDASASGSYACDVTLDGTTTHSTALAVTILRRPVTVTANSAGKVYDGTALTDSGFTAAAGTVVTDGLGAFAPGDGATVTVSGSAVDVADTAAGNNRVTGVSVTRAGTDVTANYQITAKAGTLTVTKAEQHIAVSSVSAVYDGAAHPVSPALTQGSGALTVTYEVKNGTQWQAISGAPIHAGVYRAAVSAAETANYAPASHSDATVTVTALPVTLTAASAARAYNGTALRADSCAVAAGFSLAAGDTIDDAGVVCDGTITDKGSVTNAITAVTLKNAGGEDVTADYQITRLPGTLTVTAIETPLTVTANSASKTYDAAALTADGFTFTPGVLLSGDTLTAAVAGSQTDVGSCANKVTGYQVLRGGTDITGNYTFAPSADGTLTVNKRPVTLTSGSWTREYNGTALTNSDMAISGDGFTPGQGVDPTFTGSQLKVGSSANTFTYTAKPGTNLANYQITKTEGLLTVNPVSTPLTVTAASAGKVYDGTPLTAGYTCTGALVTGDTLAVTVTGTQTEAGSSANSVTSCRVLRGQTDVTDSYSFLPSQPGTLTVTQAQLPAPQNTAWNASAPGTLTWTQVDGIGAVEVSGYRVTLYKDGTAAGHYSVTGGDTTALDLSHEIRTAGAGAYTADVTAVASLAGNVENRNVADSAVSAAVPALYAAQVTAEKHQDTVSQTVITSLTAGTAESGSCLVIAGESFALSAALTDPAMFFVKGVTETVPDGQSAKLQLGERAQTGTVCRLTAVLPETLHSAEPITVVFEAQGRQNAPVLGHTDETVAGRSDGAITGVTGEMEYRTDGGAYQPITGETLANLPDGTYFVRYAPRDHYDPSADTAVEILPGRHLSVTVPAEQTGYTLLADTASVDDHGTAHADFALGAGYSRLDTFAVTASAGTVSETENGDGSVTYTVSDITADTVLTVTGVADITKPETQLTAEENTWTALTDPAEKTLYFAKAETVRLTAADQGSGVDFTGTWIAAEPKTEAALAALDESAWTKGTDAALAGDGTYFVYGRATDRAGNTAFVSTGKLVIDTAAPQISGIENGAGYCAPTGMKVTDENLAAVTVNGTPAALGTDGSCLLGAVGKTVIRATDLAGNVTEWTVTVNGGHTDSGVWILDKAPTIESEGLKHMVCAVCGETVKTETIPRLQDNRTGDASVGDLGTVKKECEVAPGAPDTSFNNTVAELRSMNILTQEDEAQIANGENVRIFLEVSDITETVSDKEKRLAREQAADAAEILYLDLSLFKQDGTKDPQRITSPGGAISVTIDVPEKYRPKDETTLYIICVHEGVSSKIFGTYDSAAHSFTFTTDKFSTYALAYSAEAAETDGSARRTEDSVQTGDRTHPGFLFLAMAGSGLSAVGLLLGGKRRKKEKN